MSLNVGVFSEFRNGITASQYTNKPAEVKQEVKNTTAVDKDGKNIETTPALSKKDKVISTIKTVAPIAVPLIAIPITAGITYKLSNKNIKGLKNEISALTKEVANLKILNEQSSSALTQNIRQQADAATKSNAQIWAALLAVAGIGGSYKAGQMSSEEKDGIASKIESRVNTMERNSQEALSGANQALASTGKSLGKKYTQQYAGIPLLVNKGIKNRDDKKYAQALKSIRSEGVTHLFDAPHVNPITKENPAIWSVTCEFAPVKEGGLGSVPVEIQNNFTKLGVQTPSFVPMYQEDGTANFREENGNYFYTYGNKEFKLDKVASFKMDTYRNGDTRTEDVEIFVHNTVDKDSNPKQLIFIKNDNYFDGTIYQPGDKTEEEEKFAVFSKAVYEFAKVKEDIKSIKSLNIYNRELFDSIPSPDALILNDWQAAPIAALARYKAPMENAHSQLSDEAAQKLQNMNIITIGHNAMHQGSTRNNNDDSQKTQSTSNILNTLFDTYAMDIVSNAKTGASQSNPSDWGLRNLDNVLVMNENDVWQSHTNFLNMGICLSDYFCPVSKNYTEELVSDEHPELAGELRWAMNVKKQHGGVVGIVNGNDFNNLSIEAKKKSIKDQTGLDFKTYNKQSDISEVMKARTENKIVFYNNFMKPFSNKNDENNQSEEVNNIRKLTSKLECVDGNTPVKFPDLSDDELANTPVISSVGRLVSQKGIPVMTDAIAMLMENWEKDFPGKNKPIFYIAGQDGENGVQKEYIKSFRDNKISKDDANRIIFAHGFAPMAAITAASDFFLLPSMFEPCGLTQGESLAVATPVIGSAVGGIVDTVNRNGKVNGILTTKNKPVTAEEFYKALKEGLTIYFNDPAKYQNMVKDALAEDFSWIQPGKKGPCIDYLELIGKDRESLPEVA